MSANKSPSDDALQVAECYAIVFPERPARTKVMQWVNRARKAATGERGLKSDEMRDAVNELLAAELLLPSIEGRRGVAAQGPSAKPGTITQFCEAAAERGTATFLLDSLDNEGRKYHYSFYNAQIDNLEQHVRLALIKNEFARFADIDIPGITLTWLTEPRAKPYLERLPEPLRSKACIFGLQWLVHFMQPFKVFAKTCGAVGASQEYQITLAKAMVFEGNFAVARQCIETARQSTQASKYLLVEACALEALILTLQGDDAGAMKAIEASLETERSGTRKRIVYPDSLSFGISMLSLVREGTPIARAQFDSLLAARKKLKIESDLDHLFLAAQSSELPHTHLGPLCKNGALDLYCVLFAIGSRWHTDYNLPAEPKAYRHWLERLIRQANSGGYSWVVCELMNVAEATFAHEQSLSDDIKALLEKQSVSERQEALGIKSLTHLVQSLESWEFSLRELEQLALKASKPKDKPDTPSSSVSRRLIWLIHEGRGNAVSVSPIEQSLGKNGQWSAGRKVALKRLREQADSMPHLINQDIKAGASIQKQSSYGWGGGAPSYETTARTVFQLTGHPHVYDEQDQRLDVTVCPAELCLVEHEDHVRLTFEPAFTGHSYRATLDRENRQVNVTHFTAAQQRIHAALPGEGLRVPGKARERLQKLATELASDITVKGSASAATTKLHPGNSEPVLSLEPLGTGLRVRLRVEPLADSGVFFDVGTGGAVVYVPNATGTVSIQRDLAQEQALLSQCVSQSSIMSEHYDGRTQFELENISQSLELLEEVQEAGIRCVWPGDIPFRIKARGSANQVSLDIRSAKDWFAASGSLKINNTDEEAVTLEKLLELIGQSPDSRFMELGKGEFLALSKTLHQQLTTLLAFSNPIQGKETQERIHPMAAIALEPLLSQAQVKSDKSWKRLQQRVRKALTGTPVIPNALDADLRAYQQEGFVWLARLGEIGAGACLADDMGLGKTVQTLAVLQHRASQGPSLVVAPTSVTGNWLQEAQRFAPSLSMTNYAQSSEARQSVLKAVGAFDVVVISYGLLLNDIEKLQQVHWHTVVLDEAQAIKNAATGRAKAAKKLKADFRIVTTGTPVQNNLMDLHSLFSFLNPQLLGSEAAFRKRYALPISRDQDAHAREQLQQLVSPFLLRRNKREVLRELPARTELRLDVTLSPEEATLYETVRKEALTSLEEGSSSENAAQQKMIILSYLTRLRRLCCNPILIAPDWKGRMSKLEVFADTLSELIASGHKALVFSQFVDHLKIVEQHLKDEKISYQYLDGSTPAKQRTKRVSAFQAGEGDVFLISLTAGGTGLNLTAADYVIHLDPWWNPAVEDQASDRAHRLGQQRPVTIVRMVTSGTIEEQIQQLHGTKRELADSVLAGTDAPALDAERMMQLLRAAP